LRGRLQTPDGRGEVRVALVDRGALVRGAHRPDGTIADAQLHTTGGLLRVTREPGEALRRRRTRGRGEDDPARRRDLRGRGRRGQLAAEVVQGEPDVGAAGAIVVQPDGDRVGAGDEVLDRDPELQLTAPAPLVGEVRGVVVDVVVLDRHAVDEDLGGVVDVALEADLAVGGELLGGHLEGGAEEVGTDVVPAAGPHRQNGAGDQAGVELRGLAGAVPFGAEAAPTARPGAVVELRPGPGVPVLAGRGVGVVRQVAPGRLGVDQRGEVTVLDGG